MMAVWFIFCVLTLVCDAIVGYYISKYTKIHPLIGILSGLFLGVIAFTIILLIRKKQL